VLLDILLQSQYYTDRIHTIDTKTTGWFLGL
jgi:hypothetical protein